MTPGDDDDLPSIGNKCLELCKLLGNQGLAFSFNLSFGTFCFSLDTTGMRSSPAQVPVKKKKSPSAINRDKRRWIAFLRRKDAASSSGASLTVLDTLASSGTGNPSPVDTLGATTAFESPQPSAHKEPTQPLTPHPQSQAHCPSSADSTDIENIEVQQNMVTGDWISHPRSHSPINQLDGISDPSDKDDDHSQHNDDTNNTNGDNHSEILCAMCNLEMTPTHQCCETTITQPNCKVVEVRPGLWEVTLL